jgi:hypothetical protein
LKFHTPPSAQRLLPLLLVLLCFTACGGNECGKLHAQKLMLDSADPQSVRKQIYRLTDCGFDSTDCEISAVIAGMTLLEQMNQKQPPELTYGEIIRRLEGMKQTPLYREVRTEIIKSREHSDRAELPAQ